MQTFHQWQQAPIQGAIIQPVPFDKESLLEDLDTAFTALTWAKKMADQQNLKQSHSALYTAICDALNGCSHAMEHIDDAPDQ
jgi:hypothetical protein